MEAFVMRILGISPSLAHRQGRISIDIKNHGTILTERSSTIIHHSTCSKLLTELFKACLIEIKEQFSMFMFGVK